MDSTEPNQDLDAPADQELYRIGTVTKLTGIAVERLRAWERRYGITPVHRAGKTRFYSAQQVEQLQRIKRLVDAGHPISSLVELSSQDLNNLLQATRSSNTTPTSIGLVGPNLLVLEQRQGTDTRLNITSRWANLTAYTEDEDHHHAPLDVVVIQVPVLKTQEIAAFQAQEPQANVIVLYQFATAKNRADAKQQGLDAVPWPIAWRELEQLVATSSGSPLRAARSAPRRYSDADLIAIAASDDDPGGCPAHLVTLITQLNAFADYAASLGSDPAADTETPAPYPQVHTDATQARAQLELALDQFASINQVLGRSN